MKRIFRVKAVWDADAEVFYSQSDIEGFHIEAIDLDDFEAIMMEVAPNLIVSNHGTVPENDKRPLHELIPVILWQHPEFKKEAR